MTTSTWITMIAVCGFVWGGFVVALRTALRKEADKPD
jgi:LPS O-antigen subunit length determinant protein (WzzB/FepE family)